MRIGELARRTGTTPRALRFYETQGLLDARRAANGYREYGEDDYRLVSEILTLRAIGFSLDETRPFVDCLRAGNEAGDSCVDAIELARLLVADFPALPAAERNMARLAFLDEASRDLYPDWETKARDTVANLRLDAGRHPGDPRLATLVGELSLHSVDFRRLWADHAVRGRTRGRKRFAHPRLGELALDYVAMRAPDDPDMTMMIYSASPDSEAATSLRLLAGLAVNPHDLAEPRRSVPGPA